jgi:hypothetical protein
VQTETPDTHLSTTFQCTSSLRGRLTPYPHSPSLYVLDFVTSDNKRFEQTTGLGLYDIGTIGELKPEEFFPQGSLPGSRGESDLFVLNIVRMCQIRHRDSFQLVKTISFRYTSVGILEPRLE